MSQTHHFVELSGGMWRGCGPGLRGGVCRIFRVSGGGDGRVGGKADPGRQPGMDELVAKASLSHLPFPKWEHVL